VESRRRARVIRACFLEEDKCWFGARNAIRGNRPQLVHRQLEVTRECLHLLQFRLRASAVMRGRGTGLSIEVDVPEERQIVAAADHVQKWRPRSCEGQRKPPTGRRPRIVLTDRLRAAVIFGLARSRVQPPVKIRWQAKRVPPVLDDDDRHGRILRPDARAGLSRIGRHAPMLAGHYRRDLHGRRGPARGSR